MTTQLGFGCAFPKTMTKQRALYLLDAAYDAGIRHFDVAPFYIDGRAEEYVGSFLARHQDATITTKYGLRPPAHLPVHVKVARVVLGPAVRLVRQRLSGPPNPFGAVPLTAKASFRPDDIMKSINRSIVLLKRPYIDLLLLHEADARDVSRDGLNECLNGLTSNNTVGALGIGGEFERVASAFRKAPRLAEVAQFNWDVTRADDVVKNVFKIFFRVVSRNVQILPPISSENTSTTEHWSRVLGLDLTNADFLAKLMLKAALTANPNGIVLTTSTDAKHIVDNVKIAEDSSLEQPALAFNNLLISRHAHLRQAAVTT